MFKFFRGLFAEDLVASLGRVGFWIAYFPAIYIWSINKVDIQPYHFYILGIFILYNFSKKIPLFIALIKAWKGTDDAPKPTENPQS